VFAYHIGTTCNAIVLPGGFIGVDIFFDTAYRGDGIHYYKKGAALYFSAVLPQLLQV